MPEETWNKLRELPEEDLRLKIMLPLLAATPGLHRISDVHGKNEKGLDIIFYEKSAISDICYGLQLKQGNIGGGGTNTGTVREIIDQLDLAKDVDHPVVVEGVGRVQIDRFIIATSGRISETARDEIASRFKAVPVTFWDGTAIERRTRELMPELFSIADGSAVVYLKSVTARYNTLDTMDQLPGVAKRTLTQIYEEPQLRRRFDPSIAVSGAEPSVDIRFPALRLADLNEHSVVIGDQDDGKTALLRMLALKRARDILGGPLGDERRHLPIIVRAQDILTANGDVVAAIKSSLTSFEASALLQGLDIDLLSTGYLVLIDGFSELRYEAEKEAVEEGVRQFTAQYSKARVILAARPVDFLTAKYFKDLRHHVLEPFSQSQVASLLNRWTSDSPALADVAKRMVTRIRQALQLPGSPISATIGVMLYETERRYITNTAEAVDRYMVIRLGRYAHELGMRQQVEWARKQDVLSEVAVFMIENELDCLKEDEFVAMIDGIYMRLGETPMGSVVLGELLEGGVVIRNGDQIAFHRTAFRDFFAGHAINQRSNREELFEDKLFERKWGLALTFAAGLRRRNSDLFPRLLAKVRAEFGNVVGEPSQNYFYGAYLIGRFLSNSEATDEEVRLEVLGECILAFERALPEFVATAKKQFGNVGELAALIGVDQSFFITVGVPWLEKQFRSIAKDPQSTEDGRFLAASTYAHLGGDGYLDLLDHVASKTDSTRVLVVLRFTATQLIQERNLTQPQSRKLKKLLGRISRRLEREGRKEEVKSLTKIRSKLLQLEANRMKRLGPG